MKFTNYFDKLSGLTSLKSWILFLTTLSFITNLLLGVKVVFTTDRVREILVPPEIKKSFWIDDNKVSKDYLDQMAQFFAYLMYSSTPQTVDTQHTELLKYVSPEFYSALDSELRVTARTIKQTNVSTSFTPSFIGSDENTKTSVIEGEFLVTQGKDVIQRSQRKIEISFDFKGTKIVVTGFRDLSKNNINQSAIVNTDAPVIDPKTGKEVANPAQKLNEAQPNLSNSNTNKNQQPKLSAPETGN